jgi:23S rRNA pseudouridine1911/1915/1917 synthase
LLGIGGVKRPGIVHRLDKNTSGVMVAAKTETAHIGLSNIFANHDIDRNYNAIVWGQPEDKGIIEKPIGRSPINRKKMAVSPKGKLAITKWKILDIYPPYASLVECKLETGRTHQIRVHMSYLGYSIIGDDLYEKPMSQKRHKNNIIKEKLRLIRSFNRQALHASKLCFQHPVTKKYLEFISSLPQDMKNLIENIKK